LKAIGRTQRSEDIEESNAKHEPSKVRHEGTAMQCEDLVSASILKRQWRRPHLAAEAQEHLASCGRCSQLQAVLDSAEPADFPKAFRAESKRHFACLNVFPLPSSWRVMCLMLCVWLF